MSDNYGIKYAYWIIFRNKVTDTVRKKEIIVLIVRFIYYLTLTMAIPLTIKRIAIFLCCLFRREDGSDCGGVSTRGHGQREGPDGDKWSKTTQETLGGSGVSEANGVLRNHYHPPGATIY